MIVLLTFHFVVLKMGDAVADLVQCGDCGKYVRGKNGLKIIGV